MRFIDYDANPIASMSLVILETLCNYPERLSIEELMRVFNAFNIAYIIDFASSKEVVNRYCMNEPIHLVIYDNDAPHLLANLSLIRVYDLLSIEDIVERINKYSKLRVFV